MSNFNARELAYEVERAEQTGRDVLTEPILFDPAATAGNGSGVLYRPLTPNELDIAKRYIRRSEKQGEYEARKALAAQRREQAMARAERAAYDESRLRQASAAALVLAKASGLR